MIIAYDSQKIDSKPIKIKKAEECKMGDKIRVMYSEEEVDKRIRELGEQISKRYEGKTVHMICVLKGGVFF